MEITGICSACGRSGKVYTCSMCGSIVCADCYDHERGLCKSCKNIIKEKPGHSQKESRS